MNVKVNNLTSGFQKKLVIKNFSEEFHSGEIIGLVGKNGSGKTTLIKHLCGVLIPESGDIIINNLNINFSKKKIMMQLGVLFDGVRHLYWRLTPWQNFIYYSGLKSRFGKSVHFFAQDLFEKFGLFDQMHIRVDELSFGTKRKVAICCALANEPSFLLLDEPTNGLDLKSQELLINYLKFLSSQGKIVLIASHDKGWLDGVCSRFISMDGDL